MRGRLQAAAVAATSGMLALLIPPMVVVSVAAVVLRTLRDGTRDGAIVVVVAGLATALISALSGMGTMPAVWMLMFWLPAMGLATMLRATVSLALTLQSAIFIGGIGVLILYLLGGGPESWWVGVLDQFREVLQAQGTTADEAEQIDYFLQVLEPWGALLPGLLTAAFLGYILIGLLVGRWWQALLFNPGGFATEFQELRLGQPMAMLAAPILALAMGFGWPPIMNLAFVVGVVYGLQGIALVHGMAQRAQCSSGWLIAFYVLLVFAFPLLGTVLCWMSILDPWLDFRGRVKPPKGTV
jgi:hypothetical protein